MDLPRNRRYQLNLGKFPVIEVIPGPTATTIVIDIQGKLFIRCGAPANSDVRVGDVLTLYTEVLAKVPNG